MEHDNKRAIEASKQRGEIVSESNTFVFENKIHLTAQQYKIFYFLVSKVNTYDDYFKEYSFSIPEFCRVCGLDQYNGRIVSEIKKSLKELADKSAYIRTAEGTSLLRLINTIKINNRCTTVSVSLHESLKPFLLELKSNFTSYELLWVLTLSGKYAIRLYDIINCIHFDTRSAYDRAFQLEELKGLLGAETYKTYQTFKTRVLEPAIAEINAKTNKNIQYAAEKEGKSVYGIVLTVEQKDTIKSAALYWVTDSALNQAGGIA